MKSRSDDEKKKRPSIANSDDESSDESSVISLRSADSNSGGTESDDEDDLGSERASAVDDSDPSSILSSSGDGDADLEDTDESESEETQGFFSPRAIKVLKLTGIAMAVVIGAAAIAAAVVFTGGLASVPAGAAMIATLGGGFSGMLAAFGVITAGLAAFTGIITAAGFGIKAAIMRYRKGDADVEPGIEISKPTGFRQKDISEALGRQPQGTPAPAAPTQDVPAQDVPAQDAPAQDVAVELEPEPKLQRRHSF